MGVGSGITIDSDAEDEWRECQIKTSFITAPPKLGLFETIRVENRTPQLLDDHLYRLMTSAHSLEIPFNQQKIIQQLQEHTASLDLGVVYRLRLDLESDGVIRIQTTPMPPLMGQQKIALASNILDNYQATRTSDLLLQHKVTRRQLYDTAWKKAEELGCFDAIFTNERGHLTEGGRTNLFIKLNGQWFTPPLADGCLAGVMRSRLLTDPQMKPAERSLSLDDLMQAEEIIVCNALRGMIPVIIES
jgi:para-aminobenzoate synthetase/4-amino-4-deoxychorismate lyase